MFPFLCLCVLGTRANFASIVFPVLRDNSNSLYIVFLSFLAAMIKSRGRELLKGKGLTIVLGSSHGGGGGAKSLKQVAAPACPSARANVCTPMPNSHSRSWTIWVVCSGSGAAQSGHFFPLVNIITQGHPHSQPTPSIERTFPGDSKLSWVVGPPSLSSDSPCTDPQLQTKV